MQVAYEPGTTQGAATMRDSKMWKRTTAAIDKMIMQRALDMAMEVGMSLPEVVTNAITLVVGVEGYEPSTPAKRTPGRRAWSIRMRGAVYAKLRGMMLRHDVPMGTIVGDAVDAYVSAVKQGWIDPKK